MSAELEFRDQSSYLKSQLITCIGNKRALLPYLAQVFGQLEQKVGRKLRCWDAFSGSGGVSRLLKSYASDLYSNDLELYAACMGRCYLANTSPALLRKLHRIHRALLSELSEPEQLHTGFVSDLYAPKDDEHIQPDERVFYTRRNAMYIDTARSLISRLDVSLQPFFLAPLLSMASVHTNTSGVFKGFYKNDIGIGQYGGRGEHALSRIKKDIELPFPIFSQFSCPVTVTQDDALQAVKKLPELDLAYFDPPYNQHPYGSNYFMLNLIAEGKAPNKDTLSRVSGIPNNWRRSDFNQKAGSMQSLQRLITCCPSRYIMLSYNSEGLLTKDDILGIMSGSGSVELQEIPYATYKGSRNLRGRTLRVMEYLFTMEKTC